MNHDLYSDRIVRHDDGIDFIIDALWGAARCETLWVWGLSLNWAKNLTSSIRRERHENLTIKIFVPSEHVLRDKFVMDVDEAAFDESFIGSAAHQEAIRNRLGMLSLRLGEWNRLAPSVRDVQVFREPVVPNEFGVMVDDKAAVVGTYNWSPRGKYLLHSRQEPGGRWFYRLCGSSSDDLCLLELYRRRFVCREYDAALAEPPAAERPAALPAAAAARAMIDIKAPAEASRAAEEAPAAVTMRVPNEPDFYVLGAFDRRVTIYSQQVRALNLIHDLRRREKIPPDSRIAVIGGGIAGLTAAVAAARVGCKVTLLERGEDVLPLLSGTSTRWIHPHIYDWPAVGSEHDDAGLPVLDWSAGMADDVGKKLRAEFKAEAARLEILVRTAVDEVVCPELREDRPHLLRWKSDEDPFGRGKFDKIIFAVGFGAERSFGDVQAVPYWSADDLQTLRSVKHSILISGCGDGGLTDFIRCSLLHFKHDELKEWLALVPADARARLLAVDDQASDKPPAKQPDYIADWYDRIKTPELDAALKARLRHDTVITLNGQGITPMTLDASILNRLLAWRLLNMKNAKYHSGPLEQVKLRPATNKYRAKIGTKMLDFDRVVIRHGPVPALQTDFPAIWSAAETYMKVRPDFVRTPVPAWKDDAAAFTFTLPPNAARPLRPEAR